MKKRTMAVIVGTMVLCMTAAGCGSQSQNPATQETAAAATTAAAAAETAAAAEEEEMAWQEQDDAYLTGVKASDYVELPDGYKHLEVEAVRPVDPEDDDVEAAIETELQNHATTEEVDRRVKEGDTVSIDYVGKMDGKEFEGGTGSYDLVIGSDSFVEGFEDGLIGAKKGETRDVELTFPEDYHPEAGLNGKDVVFTVTVNKISETKVPDLNDKYVKSLNLTNSSGQAVTTVSEYREYIRSNMIQEREATYADNVKTRIAAKLKEISTFKQDPPANMIEKYNYLLTRQLNYYALQNYTDLPTLMQAYYGATADNYLDMIRDMAANYAQQGLVFQAVADDRDLNPSEDEITTAIAGYIAEYATVESADDLDRVIRESLRDDLMTNKVIEYLYERCEVKEPSAGDAEEAAEGATEEAAAAASTSETAEAGTTEEAAAEEGATEETADEKDSEKDSDKKDSDEKDSDEKNSDEKNTDEKDAEKNNSN